MIPWFFISTLNSWSCLWHQCSWRSWAPDHFFRITRREIQKVAPITKISSKRLLKKEWKKKLLSFKKSESLLTSLSSLTKLGRSSDGDLNQPRKMILLCCYGCSHGHLLWPLNRVGTGHHTYLTNLGLHLLGIYFWINKVIVLS